MTGTPRGATAVVLRGLLLAVALASAGSPFAAGDAQRLFTASRDRGALAEASAGMSDEELDRFALGRSLFARPWVEAPAAARARDGLGPLFNASSCIACHRNLGGGEALADDGRVDRSIVMQLGGEPVYGSQIAIGGVPGVPVEAVIGARRSTRAFRYADGAAVMLHRPVFSLHDQQYGPLANGSFLKARRAPALVGLGLIERIPEQQIIALADPDDADGDGISGSPRRVRSPIDGAWRLGRFGWKAERASLLEQVALALNDDMGLTSPWFPDENCGVAQRQCRRAQSGGHPEVPAERVEAIAFYLRSLKTPRGDPERRGQRLFDQLGCNACHRRGYRIHADLRADPYSDFLLHDMGAGLADPGPGDAMEAVEWRTPPLWGIGLAKRLNPRAGFLHDGRADSLEQAILWHDGEARAARVNFAALDPARRAALISFLESL